MSWDKSPIRSEQEIARWKQRMLAKHYNNKRPIFTKEYTMNAKQQAIINAYKQGLSPEQVAEVVKAIEQEEKIVTKSMKPTHLPAKEKPVMRTSKPTKPTTNKYAGLSVDQILALPPQEQKAAIAYLENENAKLKQAKTDSLDLALSNKGCVMVRGLRRFPISFYEEEWNALFALADKVRAYYSDNREAIEERLAHPIVTDDK